jgi:hypothetical protein
VSHATVGTLAQPPPGTRKLSDPQRDSTVTRRETVQRTSPESGERGEFRPLLTTGLP